MREVGGPQGDFSNAPRRGTKNQARVAVSVYSATRRERTTEAAAGERLAQPYKGWIAAEPFPWRRLGYSVLTIAAAAVSLQCAGTPNLQRFQRRRAPRLEPRVVIGVGELLREDALPAGVVQALLAVAAPASRSPARSNSVFQFAASRPDAVA
jgi:hypothetical protein